VKTKEGWGSPILYDVAAKGDKILVGYTQGISQASQFPNLSFFEIYDLKAGTLTPLKQVSSDYNPETSSNEFFSPTQAIFSPDGSKILFHYNQPGDEGTIPQLVVLDVSSTVENILVSRPIFVPQDSSLSLFWGENDTIFMMTSAGLGKIYLLGSK
jgi:hypothetical protein